MTKNHPRKFSIFIKQKININSTKLFSSKKARFEFTFLLVSLVVIFLCLLPALRSSGWPHGTDFDFKTQLYAKHFRRGDILPIWSSDDAFGIGTPLPTFYHKTFYYVSGSLLVVSNSIKLSIVGSIIIFMLVGSYGMRYCLEKLSGNKLFITLIAQTLILCNYSFTNWLVRDDMAEFSAMMLTPWLAWWCLKLLKENKFSFTIVPILFLLINAHNIIAVFGLVPLLISYLIFLSRQKTSGLVETYKKILLAVAMLTALLLPMLILDKLFLRYYDPSKITQAGYRATDNFHPLSQYFYYPGYRWLNKASIYTIQVDFAIILPLIFFITLEIIKKFRKNLTNKRYSNSETSVVVLSFVSLVFFAFLQLGVAKPIYRLFNFMQFLQFPWRLLTYISLFGIISVAFFVSRTSPRRVNILAIVWFLSFFAFSPVLKTMEHGYVDARPFAYKDKISAKTGFGSMMGIGEYLPRVSKDGKELPSLEVSNIYASKFLSNTESEVLKGGPCSIVTLLSGVYEPSELNINIVCKNSATVALPVSYNDFTYITDKITNKSIHPLPKQTDEPRLTIEFENNTKYSLRISLPSSVNVIKKLLGQ